MILYVDFDDTIHDTTNSKWPELTNPILDAQPTLLKLKRQGHKIVVFSSRAVHPDLTNQMRTWLENHKIPFDDITNIKGKADYYIDNKALRFTSWVETLNQLRS